MIHRQKLAAALLLLNGIPAVGSAAAQTGTADRARALLMRGERKEAIGLLRQQLKAQASDVELHVLLGIALAQEEDLKEAIPELETAVKLQGTSAEIWNALGEAYAADQQSAKAREAFVRALKLDASLAQAHLNLGLIETEAHNLPEAARHLDKTMQLMGRVPEAAEAHYLRAKIYSEQGSADRAAAELKTAVSLRPDYAEAWSDLGMALQKSGNDNDALAAYQRAVRLKPDDWVAQSRLGMEYLNQDHAQDAVAPLEKAMALNPQDQSTLNSLQLALRHTGQTARAAEVRRALADLLHARDVKSQNALAAIRINNEGSALEKSGKLSESLTKYRQACELYPEHPGIRLNLAVALLKAGHWDEGLAQLREAQRRDPQNEKIRTALQDALAQSPSAQRNH
jgi:Flp pilus assembly protein TadD